MRLLALCIAALALLFAPVWSTVTAAEPNALLIGTTRDPNNGAQVIVANAMGYFKANGLDVTVKYFASGGDLANAVAAQALPVGAGGSVPTTSLRAAGFPIVVLAQESNISGVTKLVAQKDITAPEQLEGKKVGVILGSQSEMLLDAVIQRLKLSRDKITLVNLGPSDMVTALIRGDVAGGVVWEPWASEAVRGGLHSLLSGTTLYAAGQPRQMNFIGDHSVLFATKDWLEKNPAAAQSVLRALLQAQRLLRNDPDRAAEAIAKELQLPASDVKPLLGNNVYSLAITPKLLEDMTAVANFLFQRGKLKSQVKAAEWVDPGPLKQVAPALVTWSPT